MKMRIKVLFLAVITLLLTTTNAFAQGAPPPPPSGSNGSSGNQPQASAPIGGGLFILLGLGAAYGGKKLYDLRKENLEE